MTTHPDHTDAAQAVVDDEGASILAGSDTAFTGHDDRRFAEESRWASLQISHFADITADGEWCPRVELSLDAWAQAMASAQFDEPSDADVYDVAFMIQRALAGSNTKNSASLIERVSLDIWPDMEGRPQDYQHPTAPMVVFLAVKRESFLWDPEHCRAIAVWFVPNTTSLGEPLDSEGKPLEPYRGRLYADTRWLDGYVGVMERYSSLRAAQEAADDLRRAVKVAATPARSADQRDVLDEIGENIDEMDAEDQRRKQQRTRQQRQFAARRQSPV